MCFRGACNAIAILNLTSNVSKKVFLFLALLNNIVNIFPIYYSEDWLFTNWDRIVKFCGGRNEIYKEIFYDYWLKNFDKKNAVAAVTQFATSFNPLGNMINDLESDQT